MKGMWIALFLVMCQIFAQAPRFENYRVPTPIPARKAPAQIANHDPDFEKQITEAAKDGPDFAGHYLVEQWTCGSACLEWVIVNVNTLKVYHPQFAVMYAFCPNTMDDEPISYRVDSKLIVVRGKLQIYNSKSEMINSPCGKYYFLWDGITLKRITR
jgi:hypothetical protein